MRPAVRAAFLDFTAPLEGVCAWMYLDVKGLVTCAVGNLIDTPIEARQWRWLCPDGTDASAEEVTAEWRAVKSRQDMKSHGGGAFRKVTHLRLSREEIDRGVGEKLAHNDRYLTRRYAEYEDWPADAQLALHSLAWACGPAYSFPNLDAACRRLDFEAAAGECRMDERGNPGLVPRNRANRVLFLNAARVVADGMNRDVLYWPRDLSDTDTLPSVPSARVVEKPIEVTDAEPHETAPREDAEGTWTDEEG